MDSTQLRKKLQIKRLELAVDEAEIRILDLEAEIEKVKASRTQTQKALEELKNQ